MRVENGDEGATFFTLMDQVQDVSGISAEPIEPRYDQLVTWPEELQNGRQFVPIGSAGA